MVEAILAPSKKGIQLDLLGATILIVDDTAFNLTITKEIFRTHGFKEVYTASDGEEALERTHSLQPDIVLLDLLMPGMDGFEYCKAIREEKKYEELPILVLTSLSDPAQRAEAFDAGATDLVTKPVNSDELIARVRVHLENRALLKGLKEYKARVDEELINARQMQNLLLPTNLFIKQIAEKFSFDIANYFDTSSEIGGDLWDVQEIDDDKVGVLTIDFSGHGVAAALNAFRLHTIFQQGARDIMASPTDYLAFLNESLVELLPVEQFATMFYGIIDTAQDTLSFATAACPSPIVLRDNKAEILDGSGIPLGVDNGASYETHSMSFKKGDMLFLYSDALIETPNTNGEYITEKALAQLCEDAAKEHSEFAGPLLENIKEDFQRYLGDKNLADDLTLNIYQRLK